MTKNTSFEVFFYIVMTPYFVPTYTWTMFSTELVTRKVLLGSLAVSLMALPYSSKVCHAGVIIFLIAWMLEGRWGEKKLLLEQNPLVWLMPAFFLLHLIGLWHTDNIQAGWANLDKKIFLLLVPIALASTRPFDKWEMNTLFGAFVASLLVATLICGVNALSLYHLRQPIPGLQNETMESYHLLSGSTLPFWLYFSNVGLASGIDLHPTYFAMYLAFALLILIYVYRDNADDLTRRERIVLYGIFSYFAFFVVFLSSKIFTVATIIIVIFAATRFITKTSKSYSIAVVSFVAVAIVSLAFFNPVSRITRVEEFFVTRITLPDAAQPETNLRVALWSVGDEALRYTNPIFGAGTGDVNDVMSSAMQKNHVAHELGIYDPHNQFIHTWLALGLVGVCTLLVMLLVPMYFAYRRKYFLISAFITLFMLACITESALEVQKGIIFFTLFSSILLFQQKGLQQAPPDELILA